jgi:hypothetical protein
MKVKDIYTFQLQQGGKTMHKVKKYYKKTIREISSSFNKN